MSDLDDAILSSINGYSSRQLENENKHARESLARNVTERLNDSSHLDVATELALSNLNLAQNEIPTNGPKNKKNKGEVQAPCKEVGSRDLCDDQVCLFDGECRSGCCTQVLTKGYNRCTPMLVGDYCSRALDPIEEMLETQKDKEMKKPVPKPSRQPRDE